ncbi:MAG: hypothetical protein MJ248_04555 [Bacilli bacterium]|nr:hypothetical protein [Bacilli bacterium]
MATITANEYYEIRLASLVSNVDKDVIIELYQPLVGAIASITYLTLVKQKRNEDDQDIYSLDSLLNNMQIASNQFLSARRSLEAVGLLKTYETVKGDIHSYIFELFAPKTPREFFDDILFRGLLIQFVGEKEAQKLAASYEIDTNINKEEYQDISASFVEVFNPDFDHVSFSKEVGGNIVGHRTKKVKSDIDIDLVLKHVEENSQIKKESLTESLTDIKQLATLFGLDEMHIAMVVIDSYNPMTNPHLNMRVAFNKAKEKAYYPKANGGEQPKVKYVNSEVNSDTILADKIRLMESTAPVVFLEYLQNGIKPTFTDISVVSALAETGLPNGIINAVVDYTLQKKNNILDRCFAEKILSGIAREGITNTLDAMNYMKKLSSKRTYTKKETTYETPKQRKEPAKVVEKVEEKVDNNTETISDEEMDELLKSLNN